MKLSKIQRIILQKIIKLAIRMDEIYDDEE